MCLRYICHLILISFGRPPFDYQEAESELILGITTELSNLNFVVMFLFECTEGLQICILLVLLNLTILNFSVLLSLFIILCIVVFSKSVYSRSRIDFVSKLMITFLFVILSYLTYV